MRATGAIHFRQDGAVERRTDQKNAMTAIRCRHTKRSARNTRSE
ncbi:hypothetical protein [Rhizobium sp. Root1203]|jgi:hypothetical protein|nr:hypothetical protein [Rhizobium sp. Root1203]